jgi:hypothetical protein
MAYYEAKLKSNDIASFCFETCQTNSCLPGLCYTMHSDTYLLALPVTWGYQTQREYYTRLPS